MDQRHDAPARAALIGAATMGIAVVVLVIPIFVPLGELAKYVVVIALLGGLLGAGFVLNGAVDWWRGR